MLKKRTLANFENDRTLCQNWELLYHVGLAPEPLPVNPENALQSYILKGHALYLPVDANKAVDVLDGHHSSKGSFPIYCKTVS